MASETVMDVVKSLHDGSIYDENGNFDSHEIADRIESAHDREVTPLRKALERIRDMMQPFAHDPVTTNGYAYKIAVEALKGGNDGE